MIRLVEPRTLFIALSLLCLLAVWLSLALGPVSLPLLDTLRAGMRLLFCRGSPLRSKGSPTVATRCRVGSTPTEDLAGRTPQ